MSKVKGYIAAATAIGNACKTTNEAKSKAAEFGARVAKEVLAWEQQTGQHQGDHRLAIAVAFDEAIANAGHHTPLRTFLEEAFDNIEATLSSPP